MARLQTFPDDIEISGNLADAQRQLGNAVPSLLGEVLARAIGVQFFGKRYRQHPKLMVSSAAAPLPEPAATAKVPRKYLVLRGEHTAHPGTGKGLSAVRRLGSAHLVSAE
jgi:DNA (cytosine-5)-methyltransferase 1